MEKRSNLYNLTLTENGDVAYYSSQNTLLDLFNSVGATRNS